MQRDKVHLEILIERIELLAVLTEMGTDTLAGIDSTTLWPTDAAERAKAVDDGRILLREHGWVVTLDDGTVVYDVNLIALVTAVSSPDIAIIVARATRGMATQLFVIAESEGFVVEHAMPMPTIHRFSALGHNAELRERLVKLLPVPTDSGTPARGTIGQDQFARVYHLCKRGKLDEAQHMLLSELGFPKGQAYGFSAALARPDREANIIYLCCVSGTVTEARNVAMLQCGGDSWLLFQRVAGESLLEIHSVGPGTIGPLLWRFYDELSASS